MFLVLLLHFFKFPAPARSEKKSSNLCVWIKTRNPAIFARFTKWMKIRQNEMGSKVGIFWEGHKIWKDLPLKIRRYWVTSNFKRKIFWNLVPNSESPNLTCKKVKLACKLVFLKIFWPHCVTSDWALTLQLRNASPQSANDYLPKAHVFFQSLWLVLIFVHKSKARSSFL